MAEGELISIETKNEEDLCILTVKGRLGITTENSLRQRVAALVEQSQVHIILDFTGVTFMDSSGMSSVLSAMRSVSENQGRICLVCDTRHILRVLRITAIDKLMAIYPTLDEAVTAFRSAPEVTEA
ncbi:MAG: STAS domain-containing protein [bacterium]|nr:STAS domain-containing protein [bacterium]